MPILLRWAASVVAIMAHAGRARRIGRSIGPAAEVPAAGGTVQNCPMSSTTLVLMGVAGSGKSTVMAALAARLGWATAEGDDFHSPGNVAKMRAGIPLTDEDRRPWLSALAAWIGEREAAGGGAGENAIVTCSALKRSYRDLLCDGHESVVIVHLEVPVEELEGRLGRREGHYMPPALLASQLETLEPLGSDERGWSLPAEGGVDVVVGAIVARLEAQRRR
jgi:gluconokinase